MSYPANDNKTDILYPNPNPTSPYNPPSPYYPPVTMQPGVSGGSVMVINNNNKRIWEKKNSSQIHEENDQFSMNRNNSQYSNCNERNFCSFGYIYLFLFYFFSKAHEMNMQNTISHQQQRYS